MTDDEYDSEFDDWQPGDEDPDAVEFDVVPCPECGAEVFDDAEQCPHCGSYIIHDLSVWSSRPRWWIVLGLLGIVAVIISLAFAF